MTDVTFADAPQVHAINDLIAGVLRQAPYGDNEGHPESTRGPQSYRLTLSPLPVTWLS